MLISIIAAQPPGTKSIARPEDELALTRVREALEKHKGSKHQVLPASSLGDIVTHLLALKPGPGDHVQIIGHGTPGMLALGYFWTGKYYSDDGSDTYALDSDLSTHGVLDGLVDRDASVSLIGCAVGENRVGLSQCDGPTLIFDLARLWSCPVSASVGPVGAEDFDDAGWFREVSPTGARRVVTAFERCVSLISPPPPVVDGTIRKLPRMVAIEEMRILGPHATPKRLEEAGRQLSAMEELFVREIPYRPLLGLPEVIVKLQDGTQATFLSSSSIIRVPAAGASGGYTDYAPVAASELQQTVRSAVRSVLA